MTTDEKITENFQKNASGEPIRGMPVTTIAMKPTAVQALIGKFQTIKETTPGTDIKKTQEGDMTRYSFIHTQSNKVLAEMDTNPAKTEIKLYESVRAIAARNTYFTGIVESEFNSFINENKLTAAAPKPAIAPTMASLQ